jgi:hypothetical protein
MSLLGALRSLARPPRAQQVAVCERCGAATARRVDVKSSMGSLALCTTCGHTRRWAGGGMIKRETDTGEDT